MTFRKKKSVDSIDREILRVLYHGKRPMTGNQLSKRVNISPPAIKPRLVNLRSHGIIKPTRTTGIRNYTRTFNRQRVNIRAPRSIFWDLDLKKKRRNK